MSMAPPITQREWTQDAVREAVALAQSDPSVAAFHRLWYHASTTWSMTRYRGVPVLKCPLDMQIYHELIMEIRPALIIETGTAFGGSALHFADCLGMCGSDGQVVTIDATMREGTITSPSITQIIGSSVDPAVVAQVGALAEAAEGPVLVSLDSDHAKAHVAAELDVYAPFVTPGSYLVVEDTNSDGYPVDVYERDTGPSGAVGEFLSRSPAFTAEPLCERYLLTMHPGGWLRRAT